MGCLVTPIERRLDLQILRAFAVLVVLLYHLQIPGFGYGFLGVDVFFVISGFLMALLYDRGTAIEFYKRRIDRLLGAYAFTLCLTAVVGLFVLVPADFSQLLDQTLTSAFFVPNLHFWNQTSYFEKDAFRPLLNLWSLGVEMQFYLIVPALYPLLRHRPRVLIATIVISFVLCLIVQLLSPKTAFFMMPFRIWEFLLGALVAWTPMVSRAKPRWHFQVLVLVLLVASVFVIPIAPESKDVWFGHPGFAALVCCLLTAYVIRVGMPKTLECSFIGRGLVTIGDYSYSIYLVHFPVIVLWNYVPFGGTQLMPETGFDTLSILLVTAAIAWISYNLVERRAARALKRPLMRLALVALPVAVILPVSGMNHSGFSKYQQNISAASQDRSPYRCGRVFRFLNPQERVCRISEQRSEKHLLLVGDSHADSLKQRFASAANNAGYDVYFYALNNPLTRHEIRSRTIIDDAERLRASAIVLHFNIDAYASPAWVAEFRSLVDLAVGRDLPTIIIGPVPTYAEHIPQLLHREFDLHEPLMPRKTRDEHIFETAIFKEVVGRYDERRVKVYDPSAWLCPSMPVCWLTSQESRYISTRTT